ncbi:MAG TPA: hypothetical protein VHA35_04675 [Dongiaceae bacterium]|jgi:hypothetical protein|nr:hypothetical protein [Dongiaceae bacterium]
MHLPLKFLPRKSQQLAELVGALIMIGFGIVFFSQYASPEDLQRYGGFGAWLRANTVEIPFLLGSIALLLAALGWLAVAVINLAGGSPFDYLIVDRTGITYRTFWRESRFAWDELGPFQAVRVSAWQGRGSQRRHWIVADGAEGALRIPSSTYLRGAYLAGSLDLSSGDAAGWLEELRQLARIGRLETEDLPPPPAVFRPPIAIDTTAQTAQAAPAETAPRGTPTIER